MANRPLDHAQRTRIVEQLDNTVLVEAAAGTGKTTMLIERMLALLLSGKCTIDTLAAVTFTRKAAAEIRLRFQIRLEQEFHTSAGERKERLRGALEQVERCFIGTIHSFCARLLRERPIEAGVDPGFAEMDENADLRLRHQVWQEYVDGLFAANDKILEDLEDVGLVLAGSIRRGDPLLKELDQLGLEVIQLGPTFLRIADFPDVADWPTPNSEPPDFEILANKLGEYLDHIRPLEGALPADSGNDRLIPLWRQILRMAQVVDFDRPPELMEVVELFRTFKTSPVIQYKWKGVASWQQELDRWNSFNELYAQPALVQWRQHRYEVVMRAIRPAVELYDRWRRDLNALNFQDLLLKSVALLRDYPQVRRYFRSRFTHILVDEFQDTDPLQAEVMLLLTADDPHEKEWRKCRPVPGSLFVVGDPKQSIYRFRRADIIIYRQVKEIIEANGGAFVPLSANFRSVSSHIQWVNNVFRPEFPVDATDQMPSYRELLPGRSDTPAANWCSLQQLPAPDLKVEQLVEYEAAQIAGTIRQALEQGWTVPRSEAEDDPRAVPSDFMIVTWSKKHLSVYGQALQRCGIPHQVTGGSAVNECEELALLHQCLRAATRHDDPVALLAVLRSQLFGISDQGLYAFRSAGGSFNYYAPLPDDFESDERDAFADVFARLRQYANWLRHFPAGTALEKIVLDLGLGPRACAAADGQIQAGGLLKALELIRAANTATWSPSELVDYIGQLVDEDEVHDALPVRPDSQAPVRVMNVHKAKGLEAPIVFLANPTGYREYPVDLHVDRTGESPRGYVAVLGKKRHQYAEPSLLAHPPGWHELVQREEQFLHSEKIRLMYVAATRAGSRLVVARSNTNWNPWAFFDRHLDGSQTLEEQSVAVTQASRAKTLPTVSDARQAASSARDSWRAVAEVTYEVVQAKSYALTRGFKPHGTGEDAAEWGTVIHGLLETAIARPNTELQKLAVSLLESEGLDTKRVDEALEIVNSVRQSPLWQRACASQQCLVEIPFGSLMDDQNPGERAVPAVIRGVVDLAFLENDKWVIVDYKTEKIAASDVRQLTAYYRPQVQLYARYWEKVTGQPVGETGLFYTHLKRYERVV